MLKVKRNTYPVYPGVAHAYPGDIVKWTAQGANVSALVRADDTGMFPKTLWSRTRPNQREEFKQPPVGIIAQVKSKGYVLELEEVKP